jgi:hypothetical protein
MTSFYNSLSNRIFRFVSNIIKYVILTSEISFQGPTLKTSSRLSVSGIPVPLLRELNSIKRLKPSIELKKTLSTCQRPTLMNMTVLNSKFSTNTSKKDIWMKMCTSCVNISSNGIGSLSMSVANLKLFKSSRD